MKNKMIAGTFISLFFLFLILGIISSRKITASPTEQVSATLTASPRAESTDLEPSGEMILIILTQQTEGEAVLPQGVWLLTTDRDRSRSNFLPLLPSQAEDGEIRDKILRLSYSEDENGQPADNFFRVLEERNLTWDGYLVMEESTLSDLFQRVEGEEKGHFTSFDQIWYQPEQRAVVREAQARLIAEVCDFFNQGKLSDDLASDISDFLDQPGLDETAVGQLEYGEEDKPDQGVIECIFPTLE
ncbi:MAG: hypothetical protein U5K99_03500 [Anaerolineales bacterium]|nr:hypothetical protein [Anaerolineales bacterium]